LADWVVAFITLIPTELDDLALVMDQVVAAHPPSLTLDRAQAAAVVYKPLLRRLT
jgi:hypothetical protein